jgi:hypothetical protein
MNDITNGLQALVARDFQFTHPRDASGSLVAVVGIRVHHGVFDILQLFGENDADAARIPADEPDVLFPSRVLWRTAPGGSPSPLDPGSRPSLIRGGRASHPGPGSAVSKPPSDARRAAVPPSRAPERTPPKGRVPAYESPSAREPDLWLTEAKKTAARPRNPVGQPSSRPVRCRA